MVGARLGSGLKPTFRYMKNVAGLPMKPPRLSPNATEKLQQDEAWAEGEGESGEGGRP